MQFDVLPSRDPAVMTTGLLGIVFEIVLTMSSLPSIISIVKARNTGPYPVLPQSSGVAAFIVIGTYGVVSHQGYVFLNAIINGICYVVFTAVHLRYCGVDRRVHTHWNTWLPIFAAAAVVALGLGIIAAASPAESQGNTARMYMGFVNVLLSATHYFAQLATAKQVISSKDSSSISPFITVGCLGCAASWFSFGVVIADPFLIASNACGLVSSTIQFALLFIYPRSQAKNHDITFQWSSKSKASTSDSTELGVVA